MEIDFKEQIKRWFPTLIKQQLQQKVEQLKKEAAQMAQTPDVSLHQYRTTKWAPLSKKAAECIEAAMAEGIPRTNPMWPDASLMGVKFKRVTKKMQTTNTQPSARLSE